MADEELSTVISVRFPADLALSLTEAAHRRRKSISDLVRQSVLQLVGKPIGYQCDHMNMTAPPGVLGPFHAPCGCTPTPLFYPSQIRRPADSDGSAPTNG